MSFKEFEKKVEEIDAEIKRIREENAYSAPILISQLEKNISDLFSEAQQCITPADRVYLARHQGRPSTTDYIEALFEDFLPLCGDRQCADDKSIIGGLATYYGVPVTVIGHRKGKNLEENLKFNFGMPNPEGYRKALRLMQQAEKFGRPIITFVDTPGAYPGIEAEARGQGEAIAKCLAVMSNVEVPVISIVIGEGGSGGALAISVADRLIMLENSVYSVLSPEGFASILWKDASKNAEACEIMKLTAKDLLSFGIADKVVNEPLGGAHRAPKEMFVLLDEVLKKEFFAIKKQSGSVLATNRYKKLRKIGEFSER